MELQNGRPADAAGRMEKEIRTYDFLDGLGVDYQRMDHEAEVILHLIYSACNSCIFRLLTLKSYDTFPCFLYCDIHVSHNIRSVFYLHHEVPPYIHLCSVFHYEMYI